MVAINVVGPDAILDVGCPGCHHVTRIVRAIDSLGEEPLTFFVICSECQRPIRESTLRAVLRTKVIDQRSNTMQALRHPR
jgi:hypothetical protein